MSDRLRRLRRLVPVALAGLLAAAGAQAQPWYRPYQQGGDFAPPPRGQQDRPPSRQQAQPWYRSYQQGGDFAPPPRGQQDRPPSRQFADPDRAANAAREATGGRVLGVQGADRDGQPGYRVRILQPDGRVRSLHFDPASGSMRD